MSQKLDSQIVDSVFSTNAEELTPTMKTEMKDSLGNVVATGEPNSLQLGNDWVARVSSMSLSIKVTPKIGNDFLSVERAITVDVNTLDKEVIQQIWKNLQSQVISGVFNTLGLTLTKLTEVKSGEKGK
jgi:hypothetical protein